MHLPHSTWLWFQMSDKSVWERISATEWRHYEPEGFTRRCTRHTPVVYSTGRTAESPSSCSLFPATIEAQSGSRFTVSVSATRFPEQPPSPLPDLWLHTSPSEVFQNTPVFYQHLLNTPPTKQECEDLAAEIREKSLVVCSDGDASHPRESPFIYSLCQWFITATTCNS
jgi:hypothetical protein